jgi:hypothetical protein
MWSRTALRSPMTREVHPLKTQEKTGRAAVADDVAVEDDEAIGWEDDEATGWEEEEAIGWEEGAAIWEPPTFGSMFSFPIG